MSALDRVFHFNPIYLAQRSDSHPVYGCPADQKIDYMPMRGSSIPEQYVKLEVAGFFLLDLATYKGASGSVTDTYRKVPRPT
jgi:hypothetical protein